MKRRQFMKSVAAAASAPLMPVKLGASPLPVSPEQYAKAAHWAGLWVHSTAATYRNVLNVDHDIGVAVFKRLQADGILGMTDGIGVAKAVTPYYEIPQVAERIKNAMAKTAQPPLSDRAVAKRTVKLPKHAKDATTPLEHTNNEDHSVLSRAERPLTRPINSDGENVTAAPTTAVQLSS